MSDAVLASLAEGVCCTVESGPGTGKTWVINQVARMDEEPVLVLAYNRMLLTQLQATLPLNATCHTFHSLCSAALAVARDDEELASAVDAAERGDRGRDDASEFGGRRRTCTYLPYLK